MQFTHNDMLCTVKDYEAEVNIDGDDVTIYSVEAEDEAGNKIALTCDDIENCPDFEELKSEILQEKLESEYEDYQEREADWKRDC